MTDYILNHSVGRSICLLYDGPSGITSRTLQVFFVNDTILRGLEDGHPKTFRRDRVLSAGFLPERPGMQAPSYTHHRNSPSPMQQKGASSHPHPTCQA